MKSTSLFLTACIFILNATPVMPHHGRSNFLYDVTNSIEGKITYFKWSNPHVYMEVTTTNENNETETWLIEGGTLIALKKQGWMKDSIKLGDDVVVVGTPHKNSKKRHLLLEHIVRKDGETFYMAHRFRPPPPKKENNLSVNTPTVTPSVDFAGTWARGSNNYVTGRYFQPPIDWPLTKLGEEQVVNYKEHNNPAYNCLERGLPFLPVKNYNHLWTRFDDRIEISHQYSSSTRTFYLNQDKHPENLKPSLLGHSIAHFDDDGNLIVDTVGFTDGVRWGLAPGLESSDQKHIRERFNLNEDGLGITFSITIEDTVYLTEPVTINGGYNRVADVPFDPFFCDLEAAQRNDSLDN